MEKTCSQSRARSPFTPSNPYDTTTSGKRKTIKQVESLAGKLIESLKAINSQDPDFVHVQNTQSLATASECRKIDTHSPTTGSDNAKNSGTNNTKDFHCPSSRKREQKQAWNLIYENLKQGNFRTSPTHDLEQLRKPTCEPRGCVALPSVAKNSTDTHWEAKSESAKENMKEKLETIGTSLQEAEWVHENLRRAGMEELSTEEQEAIEFASDSAIIDYSDDELDSDSDTDSDDEDDFPHLYANIPMPSQTPTDHDEYPNLPLTPPLTPKLKCSEPESSPYSIFDDEISYLEPEQSFEISKPSRFDVKRELTLITALINDLGQRLITYQDLTDSVFVAALYNADPAPELLSLKSFCSWKLHPISDLVKDILPPATHTVPDLRLIDSDGDVYSFEERMENLDEFEDREFGQHLARRDEWQFRKERWFLRNSTAAENEARLQHLERWYEEGRTK